MILKCANLGNGLGQSDVNPNLDGEPSGMNESPDKPPDEPLDEHPGIYSVFHFDTNPNVSFFLNVDTNLGFCLGNDAYLDTNLDDLGLVNTYENIGTDPDNSVGITAPFKLNASLALNLVLVVLVLALTRTLTLPSMMILVSTLFSILLLIIVLTQVLETNTPKLLQKGIFKQHLVGVKQISGFLSLSTLSTVFQDIVLTVLNTIQ